MLENLGIFFRGEGGDFILNEHSLSLSRGTVIKSGYDNEGGVDNHLGPQ